MKSMFIIIVLALITINAYAFTNPLLINTTNAVVIGMPKVNVTHDYSEENMNIAKLLKIDTTPTIILPSGQIIEGFKTKNNLERLIN